MKTHNFKISTLARNAALVLAALIWPAAVSAQQNMKACNLLTAAELSAAIGGNVGHATGIFTPRNSYRAGDFWSCQQTVGARKVTMIFDTLPVTAEGKRLAQEQRDRYRKAGYQIQEKEIDGSRCATVVAQPGANDALHIVGTSCERDKGPYHVLIIVPATGPSDLVSFETVASLAGMAASRVPAP